MQPQPLVLTPLLKQTIWGGRRLGTMLGKEIGSESDYAESWEIVDHGEDQSVVCEGDLCGKPLGELFQCSRRWLMGDAWTDANPNATSFPLLFKFLDCNRVLSVQVHPDDAYGSTMNPPDLGKTEAWVILHSEPESVIYAGLKPSIDREQLRELVAAGRTEEALHAFHPSPGDCVFIPAGTVHALGGGLLVAEIQQSSDTTFRLFDWNRTDADGNSRPLHIEQSLEVTDYDRGPVDAIPASPSPGTVTLVSCDKFDLRRVQHTQANMSGNNRCHLLAVIEGDTSLRWEGGSKSLVTGQTVLLPAAMKGIQLDASAASVLWMSPP